MKKILSIIFMLAIVLSSCTKEDFTVPEPVNFADTIYIPETPEDIYVVPEVERPDWFIFPWYTQTDYDKEPCLVNLPATLKHDTTVTYSNSRFENVFSVKEDTITGEIYLRWKFKDETGNAVISTLGPGDFVWITLVYCDKETLIGDLGKMLYEWEGEQIGNDIHKEYSFISEDKEKYRYVITIGTYNQNYVVQLHPQPDDVFIDYYYDYNPGISNWTYNCYSRRLKTYEITDLISIIESLSN